MKQEETDTAINCITDHEGFQPVCLDQWVLQAALQTIDIIMGTPKRNTSLRKCTYTVLCHDIN